ncbi:ATP-grasp domain-containing protein [Saccharothrix obliqua]|uniref:ATP-grasp domain-containing protein n=1 Tax=Saccharothrix obliqua TaxID=2861747 RepID=UPI001C5EA6D5|nr:hypothetical protein [Saccharothrix obliqua]MBW4717082.1 hypothetical protein [Saccharothrix obliqua]
MAGGQQTGLRRFVAQIEQAGAAAGARVRWHSDHWLAELVAGDRRVLLIGQVFPLNNAAAAQIATDKVATFELLTAGGVRAVPHRLLRFAGLADPLGFTRTAVGLPAVLKPHRESSGVDVLRARDDVEAREHLHHLSVRYRAIAVSPFLDVAEEYRVVVLDDVVLLVYRKAIAPGEWRHNLRFGARPDLAVDPATTAELSTVARNAMRVLDLRFASVDVVAVAGGLSVLEVNSGVTLEHFSQAGDRHHDIATAVYRAAVRACLA